MASVGKVLSHFRCRDEKSCGVNVTSEFEAKRIRNRVSHYSTNQGALLAQTYLLLSTK